MEKDYTAISVRRDVISKVEELRLERGLRSHKATVEDLIEKAYRRLKVETKEVRVSAD